MFRVCERLYKGKKDRRRSDVEQIVEIRSVCAQMCMRHRGESSKTGCVSVHDCVFYGCMSIYKTSCV